MPWFFSKEKEIEKESFTYSATIDSILEIKQKITDICKRNGFSYKDLNNVIIVIDEACSNVIKHAYKDMPTGDILIETKVTNRGIYITLVDKGKSFDWNKFRTPDLNYYVSIGKKGGLGLWIIRKLTDKSSYKVTPRGNELTLVKYHSAPTVTERILKFATRAKSVREKFVFATTAFIVVLFIAIYLYFVFNQRETLKEKFITYNTEIVKSIAQSSKERIIRANYLSLIKMFKEIKKNNENIDSIMLLNSEGRIIAHDNPQYLYTEFESHGKIEKEYRINDTLVIKYKDRYELVEPVTFQNNELGEVRLVISQNNINKVMASKQINIVIISILIFILVAIGIYYLLGLIIKPLQVLHEGVLAIGDGNLDRRIEIEGEDEFSEIAKAFNDMAVKFKGAQESLIEQEKIQKEIQVAKDIQQTLLPKDEAIPTTEGFDIFPLYRSAKEVGGDYFDIIKVGPNLIGVIVADVSGKGVPGSLVMTITRTVVRLIATQNKSAKSVLTKVNNFVKEDMKKGMFVTCFYMVLDSITRRINFACAGHNPLILFRAKENKVYYIKPKGFPLGISLNDENLFKKVMVEEELKLQKDDMIVIYTDGITEAMNGKRELFGEQRFVECIKKYGKLTSKEFIDNLDRELKDFTMGYPQNDDITIVAIKEKKTDTAMLNKVQREIEKLRKKRISAKEIQKKLGVDLKTLKELKKEKREKPVEKLRFLTVEQKKELMQMVIEHPEWGTSNYEKAMQLKFGIAVTRKLINNELKRVNLLTVEKRKKYSNERKTK
ncbi:MAG: SpoIIE family protein phosphatase [Candidatus Goldbacteria bacterium]|nr:SpoIIE family protein phosphatase [Candidatus Goldiibacteriota bacterium]